MRQVILVAILLVTASIAPAAAAGQSNGAYAGANVAFDVSGDAVTDYRVNGETMMQSVRVQSASEAESGGVIDAGADLSAAVGFDGAALSLGAETETSATVNADGAGELRAHDNDHGVLVVASGDAEQYVEANLSDGASAESAGDSAVAVTTANGTEGTFLVVGDGSVTVNDRGNVSARLGENGTLVFRSYPDGKDDGDEKQERLIRNGTAAAEVTVMERGGETVTDTVSYGANTSVEAKRTAEDTVEVTVDRSAHEGKVVITSLSNAAAERADNLTVTVDGEAAARASSYSELRGAIGGDRSAYMVEQDASAEASADVLVAVNHFSTRTIGIAPGEGGSTTADGGSESTADDTTGGETTNDAGQPGFGVTTALVAFLAAAFVAVRRR